MEKSSKKWQDWPTKEERSCRLYLNYDDNDDIDADDDADDDDDGDDDDSDSNDDDVSSDGEIKQKVARLTNQRRAFLPIVNKKHARGS